MFCGLVWGGIVLLHCRRRRPFRAGGRRGPSAALRVGRARGRAGRTPQDRTDRRAAILVLRARLDGDPVRAVPDRRAMGRVVNRRDDQRRCPRVRRDRRGGLAPSTPGQASGRRPDHRLDRCRHRDASVARRGALERPRRRIARGCGRPVRAGRQSGGAVAAEVRRPRRDPPQPAGSAGDRVPARDLGSVRLDVRVELTRLRLRHSGSRERAWPSSR